MVFIVVSGILAATNTNEQVFREMELDRVNVEVSYLGAAPQEVEEVVNVKIEESIQASTASSRSSRPASEGMGTVMIELDLGADARRVVGEAEYPRADEPGAGGRRRGLGRRGPVHPEAGHGTCPGRADCDPRDHAGRHRERSALRDFDRGLRGRPAGGTG